MVMVKWSKLTDISTIFNNFNNKKSGIVEIFMIKFGLTILTMKICNIGHGHDQNWLAKPVYPYVRAPRKKRFVKTRVRTGRYAGLAKD
jgi:hypothetical protein